MSLSRLHPTKLVGFLVLGLCLGGSASADELEVSASPSPVGSGARAAGMADAFVAIADDATAASWNPAGLIQLERPEISFVGSYNGVIDEFAANAHPEVDSQHSIHSIDLNYLSVVYPIPVLVLGRNAAVSLNYQRKYDFSREFDMRYRLDDRTSWGQSFVFDTRMDFEQKGGLSAITPAFAMEVTDRFSVGAALNLWRGSFLSDNGWTKTTRTRAVFEFAPIMDFSTVETYEEFRDFTGENVTVGLLWNPTDKWSFGGRYDTSFTGKVKYSAQTIRTQFANQGYPSQSFVSPVTRERRRVRFPSSFALGAAYRANDRLTVSLDVTRIDDWKDFYMKNAAGRRTSLIHAGPLNDPEQPRRHFHPTHTVRLGTEYVFIPDQPDETLDRLWTIRGGLFYDQEPSTRHPDDFFGFALGGGLLWKQRVNIDLAYQLRFGCDVNRDFIRGIEGFHEDVCQHRVLVSTVIYFP